VQLDFNSQQFLLFVFLNGGNGDPGPSCDHFFDVLAGDDSGTRVVKLQAFAHDSQILFFLPLFLGVEAGLLKFVIGDGSFHAVRDELHALLHFSHLFRQHGLAKLDARARFVNQVNGLIGRKRSGMYRLER